MSIRSELAKLRQQIEEHVATLRPKEIFRYVTVFEGVPLTPAQLACVEYNRSLKKPARVGFSVIVIQPQPRNERVSEETMVQEVTEMEN